MRGSPPAAAGFTLLELMIVVAILAIVASIGVPQYRSALRTARIHKARHELVTISHAIDAHRGRHGDLPLTLHQVGFGGKRDPWGVPYCYLNYSSGTGDGLEWAVEVGLVDPNAVASKIDPNDPGALGAPMDPASEAMRLAAFHAVVAEIPPSEAEAIFATVPVEDVRRRDRFLFPLNTDYDLFSLGADSATAVSIGAALAADDVIRANDGGYFGVAADY